jgi:hypothetical protein
LGGDNLNCTPEEGGHCPNAPLEIDRRINTPRNLKNKAL